MFVATKPTKELKDLVFNNDVQCQIDAILEDFEYKAALLENGLKPRSRVFLHGETGTGKTSLAHAMAGALKTNLYVCDGAEVFKPHLGESEKSVTGLFNLMRSRNGVFLIDEADSFLSKRKEAEGGTVSAQNRVVNTFLTELDKLDIVGLLICSTNLIDQIDPAVLRRFDIDIKVPRPSRENLLKLANSILDGRFGISAEEIVDEEQTAHGVERLCYARLRAAVIAEEKSKKTGKPTKKDKQLALDV